MNGKITLGLISAFALVSFVFGLSLATFVDYQINEEQVVLERLTTHKKNRSGRSPFDQSRFSFERFELCASLHG